MFLNGKRPPTVVRTVSLPVKKLADKDKSRSSTPKPVSDASSRDARLSSHKLETVKPTKSRLKAKPSSSPSVKSPPPRAPSLKRKIPVVTTQFDSDSDSDGADIDFDSITTKRLKGTSRSPPASINTHRETFELGPWTEEDDKRWPIRHGAQMTNGEHARQYRAAFGEGDQCTVKLRYPSNSPMERFELVVPIEHDNYSPMDDIINTIENICRYYLPEDVSMSMLDDSTGYSRRLKRAIRDKSFETFASIVKEFNKALKSYLDDRTVANHLKETQVLDLPLIDRITSQIYSRTVSPKVETLKKYENGTSNVYGEVLASFASGIFTETGLQSDSVFVDMGSGVGNVVLQAALEIGCESWGIEQMHNPASLAAEQLTEFNARCRRWSIKPGKATLIEGDFLNSPEIDAALRRADVVLINNKAFLPELNSAILMKMLDLKEGCRVVSLKSFVPIDWKIKTRNVHDPRNLLRVERKEYFSGGVSWTHDGGEYFVATKDSSMLQDFLKKSPMI